MGKQTPVGAVVLEYLGRFPDMASRSLGRLLCTEHPALFTSEATACSAVRYYRNAVGKRNRDKKRATYPRTKAESDACHRWGALLPEPATSEFAWYDLGDDPARWLILSDLHIPYHDDAALRTTLAHADGNCTGVLILGDGIDAYQLSHWLRDPRRRKFSAELDDWKRFLDALAAVDGVRRIVWKAGNHEYRLERYLMARAPELFDLPHFSWQAFCDLEARGIDWVPAGHPIRHHELTLIHGHEWGNRFASPVNPARGAFLRAHDCVVEGHGHRTSHHTEHTLRDRPISCWSLGCLCDLHPEYRPLGHKWSHGFAYLDTGSEWRVTNHRIVQGEVV